MAKSTRSKSPEALVAWGLDRLAIHTDSSRHDPLATSMRSLAIDLQEHLVEGGLSIDDLRAMAKAVGDRALLQRAERLAAQSPDSAWNRVVADALAPLEGQPFELVREAIEAARTGIVFTAHPTFAMSRPLRAVVAKLASGDREAAAELPDHRHLPDARISLWDEHDDAEAAILRGQDALRDLTAAVLDWCEAHVEGPWWTLRPAPLRLATWVGYDLDGRTDIHWAQTIGIRLREKALQLSRYADGLRAIGGEGIAELAETLSAAAGEAGQQADLFEGDLEDPAVVVAAANRLTEEGPHRLVSLEAPLGRLASLIEGEGDTGRRKRLCVIASEMTANGLGIGAIHLRVNAAQVRSAVQADLGLTGLAEFHDRRALAAAAERAASADRGAINFGTIFRERMTARRQLMLSAQILKHIDADMPIRFLIAEVEAPATIMGAIYLARLYGVADKVDISPLFETPQVLERGARFMERLLDEPQYTAYIRERGRLSVQFGFSDSGRFMGQVGANLAIERLHIQLVRAMAEREIRDVEVVLFNTHGESMGRGGYPGTMQERLDHLFTPWARARYDREGVKALPEVSFQGGDGYLHFGSHALAGATARGVMAWAFKPPRHDIADIFYADINFSWDIYRAIKSWQEALFDDPHYRIVLGAFPANLLPVTGSRRTRRQSGASKDDGARSLRAIPHNAALQQMAVPTNVSGGLGQVASREPERFRAHVEGSERFGRLMRMVLKARRLTSMSVLRTYADLYSPSFWTIQAARTDDHDIAKVAFRIAERLEERSIDHAIDRLANLLSSDRRQLDAVFREGADGSVADPVGDQAFDRDLYMLHAIRMVLIMEAFSITASTPVFSPRHETTHDGLIDLALDLRFTEVADLIERIFPISDDRGDAFAGLAEPSEMAVDHIGYEAIRDRIAAPLRDLDDAIKEITVAISHFYGAFG
jgi:phosphoenolpyruvate carboxylase